MQPRNPSERKFQPTTKKYSKGRVKAKKKKKVQKLSQVPEE
jgi:hypothetical protein